MILRNSLIRFSYALFSIVIVLQLRRSSSENLHKSLEDLPP